MSNVSQWQAGRPAAIVIGVGLAVMCMSSSCAVMDGFMTSVFEVRVRYSAMSLYYWLCAALAGGLTPLIGTVLVHEYAGQWWPLAAFYSVLAVVTLLCIARLEWRQIEGPTSMDRGLVEQ